MKWFKHYADLSQDPKIERLEARMGLEGYAMLLKTFELCAAQLKQGQEDTLFYFSKRKFKQYLGIREITLQLYITNTNLSEIFKMTSNEHEVIIDFPKLLEIRDNHTKRSVVATKPNTSNFPLDKDKDKERDKDIYIPPSGRRESGSDVYPDNFEQLWKCYPRKVNKRNALKAWKRIPASEHDALVDGLQTFCKQVADKDPKFIPYFSSWLNGRRWEDEVVETKPKGERAFDYLDQVMRGDDAS